MKKLLTGFVAFAMVLTLVGGVSASAKAATAAEIAAMIASLQAQLASMGGSSSTGGYTFNVDLTMGSKGADVTALQNLLIGKGYSIPAGATGYFGAQTRTAVMAWQKAAGISPAAGYFGPKSRQAVNAMASTGGTTTGGTTTTGSTPVGITTPGVEGIVTVTLGATPVPSNIYAGDKKTGVLGIQIQVQQSDVDVQRVQVNLGTNTQIFNKVYQQLYLLDPAGNVLGQTGPLSLGGNVVKSGSNYYVTLSGFHYVIPKGTTKTLAIAADLYPSIDSAYTSTSYTLQIDANGVRTTDGAGIDQYGPTTAFSRSATPSANLVDSASLQISTDSATAKANGIVATGGSSNNQYDAYPILTFDLFAQKDNVQVTDFAGTVSKTGTGAATGTTAYLYDGSTLVGSASINSSTGAFTMSNINLWVNKDTTKVLTLKVDVRSANATAATLSATVTAANVTALNSQGSSVTPTGSATSNSVVVRSKGPVFTLVSKSIAKSAGSSQNNVSTSSAVATFTYTIQALGGDVTFGTTGSTTPAFGTSTTYFQIYKAGTASTQTVASTTGYSTPSTGVVTTGIGPNSFKLQQNNSVTLPVSFTFEGRTTAGSLLSTDSYAVGVEGIKWSVDDGATMQTSNFMSGLIDWRTDTVSMP